MYEPHLTGFDQDRSEGPSVFSNGSSLLDELDKVAPIQRFDAFPKVQSTYISQSRRGGVLTAIVSTVILLLVLNDLGEFLYGAPDYSFTVDQTVERDLQLNVDLTVAMPCHYLSIDLRDAVGDRLHLSDQFVKDETVFAVGKASSAKLASPTNPSAHDIIDTAKRRTPNQRHTLPGISKFFVSKEKRRIKKQHAAYRPTYDKVKGGPACRIYGSVEVKKVTANLHITTLGHGYMSYEHTNHELMNLTHVVHEFSFGPHFPAISQPLDLTVETTPNPFTIFQYFLRVVPSIYIDAHRRRLETSQYAVTDYSRSFEHGQGVPGIFFKYDLEGMVLTIRERTTTLYQFLIRLVGVIGGVWTVASFALRVFNRAHREVSKVVADKKEYIPSTHATPSPSVNEAASRSGYFGRQGPQRSSSGLAFSSGIGEQTGLLRGSDMKAR